MKVLLTGGSGMLGKHIKEQMRLNGINYSAPSRDEFDLSNLDQTREYLREVNPETIIHAAARVGGIQANIDSPWEYIQENIRLDSNILMCARDNGVKNFLYIGSSCIYPVNHSSKMTIDEIMSDKLEPTNEGYALAKIVGIKSTEIVDRSSDRNWKSLILSNLYGPYDHFDGDRSHLLAAAIRKALVARRRGSKEINIWGDGSSRREFTFVTDVAEFIVGILPKIGELPSIMNLGSGEDHSVLEYYEKTLLALKYSANFIFDTTRPEGMASKLMDSSIAQSHGWNPRTSIDSGITQTIAWLEQEGVKIYE